MRYYKTPDVGAHNDDKLLTAAEFKDAHVEMIADLLVADFKAADWQEKLDGPHGRLFKAAHISLSRATLAFQGASAIQSSLFPAVRNTKFFADRLPRVKVDFPHLLIPSDDAFSSDAGTRVQGDEKFEQNIDILQQMEINTRSISAFKTVTDETLEDFGSGLQGMLIKSLLHAVLMDIDTQIIAGDGVAPNVLGIRNWTGILSQTKSSDTTMVAVAKAAEKVYTAGYSPDLLLLHPADWRAAVTPVTTTVGDPLSTVDPFMVANKIFGLNVCISPASPSGLPTVLDSSLVYFLERSPLNLMMSKTNEDNFIMNVCTLRAEQRAAVAVTDTGAVCKVV